MPLSVSYLYKHTIVSAVHVRVGTASGRERAARAMSKRIPTPSRLRGRLTRCGQRAGFSLHCNMADNALVEMTYARLQPCWPSHLPTKVSRESRMQEGMPPDRYGGRAAEGVAQCVRVACSVAGGMGTPQVVLRTLRQMHDWKELHALRSTGNGSL
jgi:hypothetical protein